MTSESTMREKLNDMNDQLQILEIQKGAHYMMGSRLNQEYEALLEQFEKITGHRYRYTRN